MLIEIGKEEPMKTLRIKWQRLVYEGETCPRCKGTETEIEEAVSSLKESLQPLGVEVLLEKEEITMERFEKDPLQSNRILINDIPLEDWVGGKTGRSPCCSICAPSDCRTLEIKDEIFEVIPKDLIYEAGLVAALKLV